MTSALLHRGRYLHTTAILLATAAFNTVIANEQPRFEDPRADSYPAQWIDDSGLFKQGFAQIGFIARDGHQLFALTYRSTGFDSQNGPVWFVMHGASRAAERYIRAAAPVAERNNALAIVIEFPKYLYPSSDDYTLGVTTRGKPDSRALAEGRWRDPDDYLYSEVEHLFEATRTALQGAQAGYYLFGHSAGAQFIHRLLAFRPDARVLGAVAANAGWYTLPVSGSGKSYTMPYGLRATPLDEDDLRTYLTAPLSILVGERDIATPANSSMVRGTREAMLQGRSRRERGNYFFELGESQSQALGTTFGWRMATVPGAKHVAAQMIDSAAFFLFSANKTPCSGSQAMLSTGLIITEVLADPPKGQKGDTNGDGVRDPQADEFIELVNTGTTPVCLAGWSLGDASNPERHVFPLGPPLAPGAAIVVFGGGIPTGQFGGADIQRATFGGQLNLDNEGDVITLRDATGNIATQLSWGNCDNVRCAQDHLDQDLDIGQSIARRPDELASWRNHKDMAESAYSPGLTIDGSVWQMAEAMPR